MLAGVFGKGQTQQKRIDPLPATIEGKFLDGRPDTIVLSLYKDKLGSSAAGVQTFTQVTNKGHFKFILPPLIHPAYVTIKSSVKPKLYLFSYMMGPTDSICIRIDTITSASGSINIKKGISFSGRNAVNFRVRYLTDSLTDQLNKTLPIDTITLEKVEKDIDYALNAFWRGDTINQAKLRMLENNRALLTSKDYEILKSNIIYSLLEKKIMWFSLYWNTAHQYPDSASRKRKLLKFYNDHFVTEPNLVSTRAKLLSDKYIDYQVRKISFPDPNSSNEKLTAIQRLGKIRLYPEEYQQKLAVALLVNMFDLGNGVKDLDDYLFAIQPMVSDSSLSFIVQEYAAKRLKGADAFDFKLPDINGNAITLKQLGGKVVFVDFWFTGCFGCLQVAGALAQVKEKFKDNRDVAFLSVSVDTDERIWKRSVMSGKYTSPEGINVFTEGLGEKHPMIRYYNITAYPRMLLIGKDGKIYSSSSPRPGNQRANQELEALIEQALSK